MDWPSLITALTSVATVIISVTGAMKKATDKEKEQYLFLAIFSILAGLLLYGLLHLYIMWKIDLDTPLWYATFLLLSLTAGFVAGKWQKIRSMGLFIGFVIWLFGFFAMTYYGPYGGNGTFFPWVYILILLLPGCGLLSWLGAWRATR